MAATARDRIDVDLTGVEYMDSGAINALFAHAEGMHLIANPILMPVLTVQRPHRGGHRRTRRPGAVVSSPRRKRWLFDKASYSDGLAPEDSYVGGWVSVAEKRWPGDHHTR